MGEHASDIIGVILEGALADDALVVLQVFVVFRFVFHNGALVVQEVQLVYTLTFTGVSRSYSFVDDSRRSIRSHSLLNIRTHSFNKFLLTSILIQHPTFLQYFRCDRHISLKWLQQLLVRLIAWEHILLLSFGYCFLDVVHELDVSIVEVGAGNQLVLIF